MQDVLARYVVVAHVALLAAFLAWAHGGTRSDLIAGTPWLCLGILEMVLLFPPLRKTESLEVARRRTWRALFSNPLLYIGFLLTLYLLIQYWNGGQKLIFDPDNNTWVFSAPPAGCGPFCVEPGEAFPMLYWFPAVFAVALGITHGMNRRGKLHLLRILAANGALLSLFGMIQLLAGADRMFWIIPQARVFFASFDYAGQAGAFFTLMFAISGGLFVHALLTLDEHRHAVWLGVAMSLNLAGVFLSLSRASMLLSATLLVVGGIYALRHAWWQILPGARFKASSMFVAGLLVGTLILFFVQPGNRVLRATQTISWSKFSNVTLTERLLQDTAAWTIWKEHPWFGVGGGGYRHYVRLLTDENMHGLVSTSGSENINNDSLQFLAEHGMFGFAFMLAAVILLLIPVGQRLQAVQKEPDEGWSEHLVLFRISPITVMLLAGAAAVFVQSLLDRPFRSPAVLVTWTIALACAPAFLPAVRRQTVQNHPEVAPPEPAI